MADSKFSQNAEDDAVPGRIIFAVSGKRPTQLCQPCTNKDLTKSADFFCTNCVEYQCRDCSFEHKTFFFARNHRTVAAYKAEDEPVSYDMKGLDQCQLHLEALAYVCEDDNKLCCSKCFILNHRTCHVTKIVEKASDISSEVVSLKREYETVKSKAHTIVNEIKYSKKRAMSDTMAISNKLKNMQEQVNVMFDNLTVKVLSEVASFQNKAFENLDETEALCQIHIAETEQSIIDIENANQLGTPAQRLILAHNVKDKLNEIKFSMEEHFAETRDIFVNFDFDQVLKLPPPPNAMPGNLTMRCMYTDPAYVLSHRIESHLADRKVRIKPLASVAIDQNEGDIEMPLISGMAFLSDGRLIMVDNKNKYCLLLNNQMEVKSSYKFSYHPKSVVVVSEDEIAVTSGRDVLEFLRINESWTITLTRSCKVTKTYHSISMLDKDTFLVGAFDHPKPVSVVSVKGEEKELGFNVIEKTYPMCHSACSYIKKCNKLVITDRYAHVVYIYDIESKTKVEVKDENVIQEPGGVVVGHDGCFFIWSWTKGSVVQISHTGQILASLETNMQFICSACVSQNKKILAVAGREDRENKLKLYDIIFT